MKRIGRRWPLRSETALDRKGEYGSAGPKLPIASASASGRPVNEPSRNVGTF